MGFHSIFLTSTACAPLGPVPISCARDSRSTAQFSAQILDKFLNVMPTVTIREGHRVKVYLSGDLALPDYNHHKMPSDL
jgi:type IV secretory pathway VirB10-like protein